jgi:hypothetical protein
MQCFWESTCEQKYTSKYIAASQWEYICKQKYHSEFWKYTHEYKYNFTYTMYSK